MSSNPRLSKRDSSSALRKDTTIPPGGRKRSGSIVSTTSRVSMFMSPAKHFGLTRKASTATLSVTPVSVTGGGLEHTLDSTVGKAGVSTSFEGQGTDKLRPLRQATRAADALRSVQARVPQSPVPLLHPDLTPLSQSPPSTLAPLPSLDGNTETPLLSASPTTTEAPTFEDCDNPKRKSTIPSLTPGLHTLSSQLDTTNQDTNTTASPIPSSPPGQLPPVQAKFRTPSLTPRFGTSRLPRKSSTSSIRSPDLTNSERTASPSPSSLSQHYSESAPTPTISAPSPLPASRPIPEVGPSKSTGPISISKRNINTNVDAAPPSPAGSWLATFRGIGRSPAPSVSTKPATGAPKEPKLTPNDTTADKLSDDASGADFNQFATESSIVTLQPTQRKHQVSKGYVEPSESHDVMVVVGSNSVGNVGSPSSTNGGADTSGAEAHTLTINTLAAQHGAGIDAGSVYSPAAWLAWITSAPSSQYGSPSLVHTTQRQIKHEIEDTVMYIDSDGEGGAETGEEAMAEYNGLIPAMTPVAMDGGVGDRERRAVERSRVDSQVEVDRKGKGKALMQGNNRLGLDEVALSKNSAVPVLNEGGSGGEEKDVPVVSPIGVKPVTQNTLNLNAVALRYALQLPLLGRSKQACTSLQGERPGQLEPSSRDAVPNLTINKPEGSNVSGAGAIVTRYSDEHDFVIVEIEVDGWILINTEGTSPVSPSTPSRPAPAARRAGGNSWWDYVSGAYPGSTLVAPFRDHHAGPADEMYSQLSSAVPSTEAARDLDSRSINSSLLSTVLRPFGRGKDTEPNPAAEPQEDTREQPAKTQAELIKEEALARQSPSVVPALPSPVLNTATKSSWVSYFSSKASRTTPTMSDGRAIKHHAENTGEMEVMDINEDDLSEPVEVQIPNTPISTPATRPRDTTKAEKPAPPLTDSPSVKRKASVVSQGKKSSASSSRSTKLSFPNLVLPTFGDTFYTVPRCIPPHIATVTSETPTPASGSWKLKRTVKNIATQFFNANTEKPVSAHVANAEMEEYQRQAVERRRLTNRANFSTVQPAVPRPPNTPRPTRPGQIRSTSSFGSLAIDDFGSQLPRVFSVLGDGNALGDIAGPVRAVVIGIHGWFPGAIVRSVFGEPTGTSVKFASMGVDALRQFAEKHELNLESVIAMPLEGEGTIERRVTKLYDDLVKHPQWIADLHRADLVLVATHSQGSIVSTHLISRLISDGHIRTRSNRDDVNRATEQTGVIPAIAPHRVCCLAMCGIHMGPLYSLNSSSLAQPYLQWFESQAARELFEFQNTESEVSRNYVAALSTALDHGTKFVYVASLNDQVVPIYSGTFVAASHPLILRGLFLDGDAYSSSDFLSNLLVLLLRVKNAGLDEQGLITHLSEATAGSLSGIGHSTAYEDLGPYSLAVRYMFETSGLASDKEHKLTVDAFQARASRNDYEIPWLLHSLISDARIGRVFSPELSELRDSFADWKPTTTILRDIQRKLAPIRMSPLRHSTVAEDADAGTPSSKL